MGIMGCLGGLRARPKTQRRARYPENHWSRSSDDEEETRSCHARVETLSKPPLQAKSSKGKEEEEEEVEEMPPIVGCEQEVQSPTQRNASMQSGQVDALAVGGGPIEGKEGVEVLPDDSGMQSATLDAKEGVTQTEYGQCKVQEKFQSMNDRPAPRDPVIFLKAVIDDVIQWQEQVASINTSGGSAMCGSDSCDFKDRLIQSSISRLRSTNEDLLRRVSELGLDLEKSRKEKHKLQASMSILLNDKYRLEKEVALARGAREVGDSNPALSAVEDANCKSSPNPVNSPCMHVSLDDMSFQTFCGHGLYGEEGSLGISHKRDSSVEEFPGKITKEDYIITENKCLKMWISAMQGSLSQMETEVTSLRREKVKLLKQVHSSFDSTGPGAKNFQDRSSHLPHPPEMKPSQSANFHKDAGASALSGHGVVSPIHRLSHQRMPRKSHLIFGQQPDSCSIANNHSMPKKHRVTVSSPVLEGDSSHCNLKHLTYRQVHGTCVQDLRRSFPKWKP